jgi:hypothetical protein
LKIAPRRNRTGRRVVKRAVQRARKLAPVPDPVCACNCPDYDPAVGCQRFCQAAPLRLSSDPLSPLEPLIAPLTFELKRLGVFYPCWSCEGHNDQAGQLWKLPRVWFYASSVVHIRALGEALDCLLMEKRVSARWRVVLTHSDGDNPDTTFSLEPEPGGDGQRLADLQADARAIAEGLDGHFRDACARLEELVI